jgi:hypothetical protein
MFKPAIILLSVSILCSCQKQAPPVDKEAAGKAVAELFDTYAKATKEKDYVMLDSTLAADGLFLGTDPEEFWSKEKMVEELKRMSGDSTSSFDFTMDKREIRVSQDGIGAIVVEQSIIPVLSKEIYVRGVGHARIIDGRWKIDFFSWALIPRNEDMGKLNKALVK